MQILFSKINHCLNLASFFSNKSNLFPGKKEKIINFINIYNNKYKKL